MNSTIEDAFEESFRELGIDLSGDTDDILSVAAETDESFEDGDGLENEGSVEEQDYAEDTPTEVADDTQDSERPVIEVQEGALLRLPDGTEVDASQAVLLQRDYTRKTQQLAEERREFDSQREQIGQAYEQMRGWYEERASDPTGWVQEIVSGTDDPTATIARALYDLAGSGTLDPAFVATFGIDAGEVADRAQTGTRDKELAELRQKIEDRERTEAEQQYAQQAIRSQVAVYTAQWNDIVAQHGIKFESREAEKEAKREVLNFAIDNGLANSLQNAYDLMLARKGRISTQSKTGPKGADPAVSAKKRASRAVAQRSGGAGAGAKTAAKPMSTRDAALEAISEFAAR